MDSLTHPTALDEQDDEVLMLQYQAGNAQAFNVLYKRHKGGLYRYFLRQLNHQPELANELFQDVWMKLIHARQAYQVKAKFSTYLYRLAHNHLVDYWRRNNKAQLNVALTDTQDIEPAAQQSLQQVKAIEWGAPVQPGDPPGDPFEALYQQQTRDQLREAIAALPEEQRSAILLKEQAAMSLADIAELTGVTRETVKSRIRYAVKRLKQVLHVVRADT